MSNHTPDVEEQNFQNCTNESTYFFHILQNILIITQIRELFYLLL